MTNRDHDDVARALEALAAGEHQDEGEAHEEDVAAPAPAAPAPVSSRQAAPRPPAGAQKTPAPASGLPTPARPAASTLAAARPAPAAHGKPPAPVQGRPPAPVQARPPAPVQGRPVAPVQARPAAPVRATPPAAPASRPAQPTGGAQAPRPQAPPQRPAAARPAAPGAARSTGARPQTPAAHVPVEPIEPPEQEQFEEAAPVDQDDQVIVPAPDASAFYHAPVAKRKAPAFGRSLNFRQTAIPVLLTGGFIMIALGAIHFLWNSDNNPMGGLPIWLVGILFLFGLVLWGLAAANMMAVNQELKG